MLFKNDQTILPPKSRFFANLHKSSIKLRRMFSKNSFDDFMKIRNTINICKKNKNDTSSLKP